MCSSDLTKSLLRLTIAKALLEALLTDTGQLLTGSLKRSAVGLSRTKAKLLLLLSSRKGLTVALIKDVRKRLVACQLLLLSKIGSGDACAVTTKSALTNSITRLTRHGLLVHLVLKCRSTLKHISQIWRHVLIDLARTQIFRVDCLSATKS